MNAHHDDNGAGLVAYDEARVSIGQAWAPAIPRSLGGQD